MPIQELAISFYTVTSKELTRIFRIWTQTLLPSVITTTLYFLVFGTFIGSQISDINGVSYIAFLVPGLVMQGIISNAFANVVSSFYGAKFQRNIDELLVSPTPNWVVLFGYVCGGAARGLIVGTLVTIVAMLFTRLSINNIFVVLVFSTLTAIVFAMAGFLNAMFAKKFDDTAFFGTFILTPLIYLGGVFYSINSLPPFWQTVSKLNPVLYLIDGFRFGFYGFADINPWISFLILSCTIIILWTLNLYLLKKGIGLKN